MTTSVILDVDATLNMPLDGIKLVEASAGTGKTYAIGNLYLRMLERYQVGEILVVTFTKAATEELRGRIRQRILDALHCLDAATVEDAFLAAWRAALQQDEKQHAAMRQRLNLALHSMDEAAIYTIHGFCQRALTEHAFYSGQPFEVEMLSDDAHMWEVALKDWWRSHAYPLKAEALSLFTASLGDVNSLMERQVPLRKPRIQLLPTPSQSLAELYQTYANLAQRFADLAQSWAARKDALYTFIKDSPALSRAQNQYKKDLLPEMFALWDGYFQSSAWYVMPEALEKLGADALNEGSTPKKRGTDPNLKDVFFTTLQTWLNRVRDIRNAFKITALADSHAYAHAQVNAVKQQTGQLAFDDQLTRLADALTASRELAANLHQRFPVAMMDEFQDTDAVQYDIFKQIYHGREQGSLMMIGDPKQAIYSFRGGDIFTYIAAKKDAQAHYTLDTNWRSSPDLIQAVNHLFAQQSQPFIYSDIPFTAVKASNRAVEQLNEAGRASVPLTIWHLPLQQGKPLSKEIARALMHQSTAQEVVRLLQGGASGAICLGEKAVKASDMAILVRGHKEATEVRAELQAAGVNSVVAGNAKVFQSEEAEGLRRILAGVLDCKNSRALRLAMASSLYEASYDAVYQMISDEEPWLEWCASFQELHELWARKGWMTMFQRLLKVLKLGDKLAADADGARRLTNLLHLGELLQQAAQSIQGMDGLLHWLEREIQEGESEAELRLESDEQLVRIVTIHASKGLEYPIVFLPYLWSCRPCHLSDAQLPFFDAAQGVRCLDVGSVGHVRKQHYAQAEKERLAEDVRLAYVALTRARSKIYLGWGKVGHPGRAGHAGHTAMGWLLHGDAKVLQESEGLMDVFAEGNVPDADLAKLNALDYMEVVPLNGVASGVSAHLAQSHGAAACEAATFRGTIASDWRISSFSGMTRGLWHEPALRQLDATVESDAARDFCFTFKAGREAGSCLHLLLEQLPFQGDVARHASDIAARELPRFGLNAEDAEVVGAWMADVVRTPLNAEGLMLNQLHTGSCLRELSFDFSVARSDIGRLNCLLDEAAGEYLQSLQPLQKQDFCGFITGVIDLVFEHNGRYYLADYKSNHLGDDLAGYAPDRLRQEILNRRYDVQLLIYSVALHRYLKLRVPDYDYEQHFGGAYYLFLRGMRSEQGAAHGIYFERPERAWIEAMDGEVFSAEVVA